MGLPFSQVAVRWVYCRSHHALMVHSQSRFMCCIRKASVTSYRRLVVILTDTRRQEREHAELFCIHLARLHMRQTGTLN